ncbi:MAG: hypothetical protein E7662_06610 [Ruminococcaceae bacterium]|nr:hypothetical protein [Oscillospiraceae bacterium]
MELEIFTDLLEAITIFCFGLSWPLSIRKSYVSRTAKGKSLFFQIFILAGYAVGIIRKVIQFTAMDASGFIFFLSAIFYVLNFIMIAIDVVLYFRNTKLDRERDAAANK